MPSPPSQTHPATLPPIHSIPCFPLSHLLLLGRDSECKPWVLVLLLELLLLLWGEDELPLELGVDLAPNEVLQLLLVLLRAANEER